MKSSVAVVVRMVALMAVGMRSALLMQAQQPVSTVAFEAASVKPNNSTDFRGSDWKFLPGGRCVASNTPLSIIIALAYDVPMYTESLRVFGGPQWIRSEKFDIQATAGAGAISPGMSVKARDDKVRLMLQSLLADRFKLVMDRQVREVLAYVVVVAKNGPKLRRGRF